MITLNELKVGQKFKVIKDIYYVSDGRSLDGEYLSKEELFKQVNHLLVVDDVWEVIVDEYGKWLQCVEGTWIDECNDGWWEVDYMLNKNVFEVLN